MADYYETLGIPRDAPQDDIRRAYQRRARATHPDHGGNEEDFKRAGEAYDVLRDPAKRTAYDQFGKAGVAGPTLETMAASALEAMFTEALEMGGNVVHTVSTMIAQAATTIPLQRTVLATKRDQLARRRAQVTTDDGVPNLVHQLIDRKISAATAELATLDRALQINVLLQQLLKRYTDSEPVRPSRLSGEPDSMEWLLQSRRF